MRIGYKMMGLGWQFVTEMIAGAFLGWAIGYWFGNETRGTIIGTGFGFVIATYTLIHGALKLNAALDKMERASGRPLPKPLANPLNEKDAQE